MIPISTDLLDMALAPYRSKGADYLQEAWALAHGGLRGRFHIGNPVHIDHTGHFNAVDAVITANQMAYTWFAQRCATEQENLNLVQFQEMQRSQFVIAKISEISFSKPMDPHDFSADLLVLDKRRRSAEIQLNFTDIQGVQGAQLRMLTVQVPAPGA